MELWNNVPFVSNESSKSKASLSISIVTSCGRLMVKQREAAKQCVLSLFKKLPAETLWGTKWGDFTCVEKILLGILLNINIEMLIACKHET